MKTDIEPELTEEQRQRLRCFVDDLPNTPDDLSMDDVAFLDQLACHLLNSPLSRWWFKLDVLSQLAEMWQLRFKGAVVDYMALQTLFRRVFREESKVVAGFYEIVHCGREDKLDLYHFDYDYDNCKATLEYRAELVGSESLEVAA
jgi:hypothetical protein